MIDKMEVTKVKTIETLKGLVEKAKRPLIAKFNTGIVFAWDFPENLFFLSNSIPIDLNPTQEKNPL